MPIFRSLARFRPAGERRLRRTVGTAAMTAMALVASGCSGDSVAQATRTAAPTAVPAPSGVNSAGKPVTLDVLDAGPIIGLITDHRGFVVYANRGETPELLICVSTCIDVWVPLEPRDGNVPGAVSDRLDRNRYDEFRRPEGITQVTYDGFPLYTWTGDSEIGITAGAGVAGIWFALSTEGPLVE